MLRTAVSRRTAQVLLRPRLPTTTTTTHAPGLQRHISFIPWRKKTSEPPLPVYFGKASSQSRPHAFARRMGRLMGTIVIYYFCWQVFASIVIDPLLDWADSEWSTMSEKEREEVQEAEEDEPILFLPFPFTTKLVKEPPYKASDPEWDEFIKINRDPELQKDIKTRLAEVLRTGIEKNPAYGRLLGGKGVKIRKYWLDIIYPAAPPPKNWVSGILVDDDGIFWGDRPMDSLAAGYLSRAIYPKAVAMTAWTFITSLTKQTVHDISMFLGLQQQPEPKWHDYTFNRMTQPNDTRGTSPEARPNIPNPNDKSVSPFPLLGTQSDFLGNLVGSDSQLDPRIQVAMAEATLTFAKNWKQVKQPPTRGCIRVDGMIELQGEKAVMTAVILGWYDPKQRKFVAIETGLKHLIQLKQRPAGGP